MCARALPTGITEYPQEGKEHETLASVYADALIMYKTTMRWGGQKMTTTREEADYGRQSEEGEDSKGG